MNLLRSILHDLALVVLVTAGVLACLVLWKALGTVDAVNATLKAVNSPCADNGHQVVCGPIAQLALAEKMIGNMAGQTQEQVRQSGLLITATTQNMDKVATSVTGEVSALQDTTKALTKTAQTASTSLHTLTDGISPVLTSTKSTVDKVGDAVANLKPVETAATKMLTDGDALANSQDVTRFLKGSADTSQQFAIIATQGAAVAADVHKEADALVAPKPWWKQVYTYGNTGVNVACLVTHSCPF